MLVDTPYDISTDHRAWRPMKPTVNAGSLIHFGPRIGVPSSDVAPTSLSECSCMKDEPVIPLAVATTMRWGGGGVGMGNAEDNQRSKLDR